MEVQSPDRASETPPLVFSIWKSAPGIVGTLNQPRRFAIGTHASMLACFADSKAGSSAYGHARGARRAACIISSPERSTLLLATRSQLCEDAASFTDTPGVTDDPKP